MDASCKIQGSIHLFRLVHNMCPEFWVHIILPGLFFVIVGLDPTIFILDSRVKHGNDICVKHGNDKRTQVVPQG